MSSEASSSFFPHPRPLSQKERRGFSRQAASALLGLAMLLSVGLLARSLHAAEKKQENKPDKKKGVYELKVDGYVEKIDPNIDYKGRLQRLMPRDPAGSLKGFHIIPGFKLELAASEPLVRDPVDLAFDENGRMYVAEMIPYAENNSAKFGSPNGRVSLLEDTDGDGRYDKGTVFLDNVVWPTGLTCFDGGLFVAATPELLYCKDTDGDGKADVREVVLSGFVTSSANGVPNSLRWSLDSRI